jgi:hypothetical protein
VPLATIRVPSHGFISMPAFAAFKGADHFYNVVFHELTHNAVIRIVPHDRLTALVYGAPDRIIRHKPPKLANWAEAVLRLLARIEGERYLIFFDQAETCFMETPKAAMSFQ